MADGEDSAVCAAPLETIKMPWTSQEIIKFIPYVFSEVGEGTPGAAQDDITSTFSSGKTEKGRRNIIQEDEKDFPEDTSRENGFQRLAIPIILIIMVLITFLGVDEVANRGKNGNVTSTPATSSHYPAYSTSTVGIKWTETSRTPQVHTTHHFTTKENSTTIQYTSTLTPVSTSHYPENNSTTVGINQTKPSTTPQQFTAQSTSTEETSTADLYTPDQGSSTTNLTSPTSLPGITTEGLDHNTTTLVTNHTLTTMLVQENTSPNSTIGENPTTGHEITSSTLENSTSLYTSSLLPESSSHYPEYNTTTVGINRTETTTTAQWFTEYNNTTEETSTTDEYTSYPGSSTSNLTSPTSLPGITTEGSDLNITTLVSSQTEATTSGPGNTNTDSTVGKNPTAGLDITTSSMENSTSLHTSSLLPESSSHYPDYNTTTVGINWTETTTQQDYTIQNTATQQDYTIQTITTKDISTTEQYTLDPESSMSNLTSPSSLPGTTTEGLDHNTTTLVNSHTSTTMLVQESTIPNSTIGENPTTGNAITTSTMENSTSLYTSSFLPESSSHYPDYNTTTVGINRTETTTPEDYTIQNTTPQDISTTDQYTSDPGSSMSNLTSPTSLPGITTEGLDHTTTTLVTSHTLTTMLVQENTNPNSTIGENPTTSHEITTSTMENVTSLYTSSLLPESSSHYPEYNTTTVGINRTDTSTPQQNAIHSTAVEEIYTTNQYTSDPESSKSNLTSLTSLPGTTTEDSDHNTTTRVPSQTKETTLVPGNPNSTTGKNHTAGLDITTSNMEDLTSLHTSTLLLESSSHYPEYNTTTVGINRTETTTPQQNTIQNTTTQDISTTYQYTSHPESSRSNLTSPTSLPGITTEGLHHNTTTLVSSHTLTTMLVQENRSTNSTIGENPTTGHEITTSTMENSTNLYTSSLLPESSSHYPECKKGLKKAVHRSEDCWQNELMASWS
ncbi:uncharacterized protein [Eleutherodactylus coqui]|uniref:uncharacterized protein n=1 Tax=Eleutherodactylus coqui TaxID=57060 RepID=UPI003462C145